MVRNSDQKKDSPCRSKGHIEFLFLLYELMEEGKINSVQDLRSYFKDEKKEIDEKIKVLVSFGYIKVKKGFIEIQKKALNAILQKTSKGID